MLKLWKFNENLEHTSSQSIENHHQTHCYNPHHTATTPTTTTIRHHINPHHQFHAMEKSELIPQGHPQYPSEGALGLHYCVFDLYILNTELNS